MKPALFILLDDTLITTLSGKKYSLHREDWKFINNAVEFIKEYYNKDYFIFIITNQLAIYNNITPEKAFHAKMELILSTLEKDLKIKKNFIQYRYCIDEDSYSFLPKPGLILDLALEYEVDLSKSILLGNSLYDKAILIYSGIKIYKDVTDLIY
jgi:histidinol phosphatase-like enzyme